MVLRWGQEGSWQQSAGDLDGASGPKALRLLRVGHCLAAPAKVTQVASWETTRLHLNSQRSRRRAGPFGAGAQPPVGWIRIPPGWCRWLGVGGRGISHLLLQDFSCKGPGEVDFLDPFLSGHRPGLGGNSRVPCVADPSY